ncbi:SemiSWEET family sugar transporter [Nocardioides sp. Kera G14]|uniref:SemiSWEET family sugar transporter n=1 Tax=Nocardioides sp. Kera G14 TaxID=2884264 RepID=UPI001D12D9FD|nr:hypothetical protein [Nocardioides sp. Kera G14]UDY24163.1 hypothetical protein LH076_02375 [Nocardioides sp. Kera G14]
MLEAVGYVGSAGAATMWLPQVVRTWRHRHDPHTLGGISFSAYAVAVLFNALLLTYGLTTDAPPVVIAAVVNLLSALAIVAIGRANQRSAAEHA